MVLWRAHLWRFVSHHGSRNGVRCAHWSSKAVRQTFIDYFVSRSHKFVPSSSVVPAKGEGTYFVNAGMNQFKPIFLGTAHPESELASLDRAVNSQKCIRVGGKHNDLEDVGKDTYHHTFFEMLGSWSFGSYFKKEACLMAWDLLTNVYQLPANRLYVTYFGGDDTLRLRADTETRDLWRDIGVPAERVLPFGSLDNFWDMGDTGPCGPCTEIHYDHRGTADASQLVNTGDPLVVELWNLVFMQFDRQLDGSIVKLPRQHVDTGMGLERLTAVLQGKVSNYDTDLFSPLMTQVAEAAQGTITSDEEVAACRLIADHARMIAVALADGLRPGKNDIDKKLRQVMYRCYKAGHQTLHLPQHFLADLMPTVVDTLSFFPELQDNLEILQSVCDHTEERYLVNMTNAQKMLSKALHQYGHVTRLTGSQIMAICEGQYGKPVTLEDLQLVAADQCIVLDEDGYLSLRDQKLLTQLDVEDRLGPKNVLSRQDLQYLQDNAEHTDDSHKYRNIAKALPAKVIAVRGNKRPSFLSARCGEQAEVILDQTLFYAEAGGQVADVGYIRKSDGTRVVVNDVQTVEGYVVHSGMVEGGELSEGDTVELDIHQTRRSQCSVNHTATHVIHYVLEAVLGGVTQAGSLVEPGKLSFAFTCSKPTVSLKDLTEISEMANEIVDKRFKVYCQEVEPDHIDLVKAAFPKCQDMQERGLRMVSFDVPPGEAAAIKLGQRDEDMRSRLTSVEACGGTHVSNTQDIGHIVVTNFTGFNQGTKRLTAVTGHLAEQAFEKGRELQSLRNDLVQAITNRESPAKCHELVTRIQKILATDLLPKVVREQTFNVMETLTAQGLGQKKNLFKKDQYRMELEMLLIAQENKDVVVAEMKFDKARDVLDMLGSAQPTKPLLLLCDTKELIGEDKKIVNGISYVPQDHSRTLSESDWALSLLQDHMMGSAFKPRNKYAARVPTACILKLHMDKSKTVSEVIESLEKS